jgi:hypothetical protein
VKKFFHLFRAELSDTLQNSFLFIARSFLSLAGMYGICLCSFSQHSTVHFYMEFQHFCQCPDRRSCSCISLKFCNLCSAFIRHDSIHSVVQSHFSTTVYLALKIVLGNMLKGHKITCNSSSILLHDQVPVMVVLGGMM